MKNLTIKLRALLIGVGIGLLIGKAILVLLSRQSWHVGGEVLIMAVVILYIGYAIGKNGVERNSYESYHRGYRMGFKRATLAQLDGADLRLKGENK